MTEISKNTLLKRDIESDITFTKVSGNVSWYILLSGSLWISLSKSMAKNKRNVSLEIFKTVVYFLSMTIHLGVANNRINAHIHKEWFKKSERGPYKLWNVSLLWEGSL